MVAQQAPEKPLNRSPIPLGLKIHINHLTILIDGPPQVMLLAIDFHEDLVNVESIAITSVLSFQSA